MKDYAAVNRPGTTYRAPLGPNTVIRAELQKLSLELVDGSCAIFIPVKFLRPQGLMSTDWFLRSDSLQINASVNRGYAERQSRPST